MVNPKWNLTTKQVVETTMRFARKDSGLTEADREVMFFAHSYFSANWDEIEAILSREKEEG